MIVRLRIERIPRLADRLLLAEPPVAILVFLRMDFVLLRIALKFYHLHLKQAADFRYRVKILHVLVVYVFHEITLLTVN